jgi:hypothetical protein
VVEETGELIRGAEACGTPAAKGRAWQSAPARVTSAVACSKKSKRKSKSKKRSKSKRKIKSKIQFSRLVCRRSYS